MKTIFALLLLGASIVSAHASDSSRTPKSADPCAAAGLSALPPAAEPKPPAAAAPALNAPARKPAGKPRDAGRTPLPAHLFM